MRRKTWDDVWPYVLGIVLGVIIGILFGIVLATAASAQGFPPDYRGDRFPQSTHGHMFLVEQFAPAGMTPDGRTDLVYGMDVAVDDCTGDAWLTITGARSRTCGDGWCCAGGVVPWDGLRLATLQWNEVVGAYVQMIPLADGTWALKLLSYHADIGGGTYLAGRMVIGIPFWVFAPDTRWYRYGYVDGDPPACTTRPAPGRRVP